MTTENHTLYKTLNTKYCLAAIVQKNRDLPTGEIYSSFICLIER